MPERGDRVGSSSRPRPAVFEGTIDWDAYWREDREDREGDGHPASVSEGKFELLERLFEQVGVPEDAAFVGCGPAVLPAAVATAHPEPSVVGYDAAASVIAANREQYADVPNVSFETAVLPEFDVDRQFDLGYAGRDTSSDSRFEGEPCPSLGAGAKRTICYHAMDDPPVYLVPSTERFVVDPDDDAVETVEFTLRDESPRTFQFDPQRWVVVRRDGTEWYRAAPDGDPVVPEKRPLDGTHTWSLSLRPHPSPRAGDTTFVTADLEEGLHAFAVSGHLAGDDDRDVTCLALFELVKR